MLLDIRLRLPVVSRTSETIYCDSYYCPDHYTLKKDADEIKCDHSGCTTSKCCKYHCELYHPNDLAKDLKQILNTYLIPSAANG